MAFRDKGLPFAEICLNSQFKNAGTWVTSLYRQFEVQGRVAGWSWAPGGCGFWPEHPITTHLNLRMERNGREEGAEPPLADAQMAGAKSHVLGFST